MASPLPACPVCRRVTLELEPSGALRCPDCGGRFAAPLVSGSSASRGDEVEVTASPASLDAPGKPVPRPLGPSSTPGELPFSEGFLRQYQLVSFLGKGAMGTVYLMKQLSLNRLVAVKVVHDGSVTTEMHRRLVKEAQALAALNHDHVIAIHDVGLDGTTPYMVSEYIKGETVADRLQREPRLTVPQALRIVTQVLDGMRAAHKQGIIHRDLKPANIFLGPGGKAKIGDFGLAKQISVASGTASGRILGTPGYMSPEQCRGAACTPASDIYSIGVTLFELLAHRRPFQGPSVLDYLRQHTGERAPSLREVEASVPAELEPVVARAMQKDPAARFASCLEFKKALQEVIRGAAPARPRRAAPTELEAGARLADRYELVELLGQGGMAQVWLARDELRDVDVAIKVLPPELWRDPEARASLIQEANTSLSLVHRDIVRIINVEPGESPYLVMELVRGPTLAEELVRRRAAGEPPLGPAEALDVLEPAARALQYAHEQGVIHRDIKPSNLLLEMDEQRIATAKLADFGIAAEITSFKTKLTGAAPVGTLAYMSPEQVACRRLDARSDVYSLGATLYQMLTFRPPFVGGDIAGAIKTEPPQPPDGVPPAIAAVVLAALAKNPDDRPRTALDLAARFKKALEDHELPPTVVLAPPPPRRRLAVPALIAIAAAALLAPAYLLRPRPTPSPSALSAADLLDPAPPPPPSTPTPTPTPTPPPATPTPTPSPTRPPPASPPPASPSPKPSPSISLNTLAARHASGEGAPQSDEKALQYFRQAAAQNDPKALFNLAQWHRIGRGVPRDDRQAFLLFQKAAELNLTAAMSNLGRMYLEGLGTSPNGPEAVRWLTRAAEKGDAPAQYFLALCHGRGSGTKPDRDAALRWMRKSAAAGYEPAIQHLDALTK